MLDDVRWGQVLPIIMVFGGCICSTVAMEAVLKGDPQAGNLFSLSKTLLLLLQGLPGRFSGFKPARVAAPLSSHLQFALLWSTMSILANYAFSFKISMTMFALFPSAYSWHRWERPKVSALPLRVAVIAQTQYLPARGRTMQACRMTLFGSGCWA